MAGDQIRGVKIGIIGGSGLYQLEGLQVREKLFPETPWGRPSDLIIIGELNGKEIAFLPRHGEGHFLPPHQVPWQANIAALKMLGVEEIVAFSAVGSLKEEIRPCDFVLPDQIIDRSAGMRPFTFFEDGIVVHASFGDPFSSYLRELIYQQSSTLAEELTIHRNATVICIQGPTFATRAESRLYRQWGGDIINMSVLPEARLAREAEIAYQMICMSTDYDSWRSSSESVTAEEIIVNLKANANNGRRLLGAIIPELGERANPLKGSIKGAIITDPQKRPAKTVKRLNQLLPGYF